MSADIHVVAVGARTPVGLDAESSAAAVRAGISRVGEHPFMVDGAGAPLRCGRDRAIKSTTMNPDRLIELAVCALGEAARKAFATASLPGSLSLFLGLPNPRPGFGPREVDAVARGVELARIPGAPRLDVTPVVGGHAAAIQALDLALKRIVERQAEVCVAGGVDSYLDADALNWLEGDRRLAREGTRGGFTPGEAAAMLCVANQAGRARLGLSPLARVRGVATGYETRSIDSDEGLLGEGLTDVVRRASQSLRLPDERVEEIYCDINGERHRTDEWTFAVLRAWQVFRDGSAYKSAVSAWGDVGAASGAVNCVLAVQAWQRHCAIGQRSLVWGSSPEGLRGAAILERGGI